MRCALAALACTALASAAAGQNAIITYQGQLRDGPTPASGAYDLRFTVFTAPAGGVQLGPPSTHEDVPVENGVFTVPLSLSNAVFTAFNPAWLEVEVRPGASSGAYELLSPRQYMAPAPFSLSTRGIMVHPTTGFVGIGRDSQVTSQELFGLYAPTSSFAGMYIRTDISGLPFYGYSENGNVSAYHYWNGPDDTWRLNVSGDRVIVNGQGNVGIATAAPAERLDVNGNTRATDFLYGSAKTHYLAVPGCTFTASDGSVAHSIENAASGTRFPDTVAAGTFFAPINLPDGALITAVDFWLLDNAASFLTASLIRRPNGQFGANTIAATTTANSAGMQQITLAPALPVDNQNNSYYLSVTSGDWQAAMALFSARVTYTVTRPD